MTDRDQMEWNMILELQSPDCSYERAQEILEHFYNAYKNAIYNYIYSFFKGMIPDIQDAIQESNLAFFEYLKYKIKKMPVLTGFYPWLHQTLSNHIRNINNLTQHDNIYLIHYKKVYDTFDLAGNEDIWHVYSLYLKLFSNERRLSVKHLLRIRNYLIEKSGKSIVSPYEIFSDEDWERCEFLTTNSPCEDVCFRLEIDALKSAIQNSNSPYIDFFNFIFQFTDSVNLDDNRILWDDDMWGITKLIKKYVRKSLNDLTELLFQNQLINNNLPDDALKYIKEYYYLKFNLGFVTYEKKKNERSTIRYDGADTNCINTGVISDPVKKVLNQAAYQKNFDYAIKFKKRTRKIPNEIVSQLLDEYENTDISQRELALKYNISINTVAKYIHFDNNANFRKSKKKPDSNKMSLIAEEYQTKAITQAALASKYNVSLSTMRKWLHEAGIETRINNKKVNKNRKILTPAEIDDICKKYEDYFSVSHLADEYDVSKEAIYRHLRTKGLVSRDKGHYLKLSDVEISNICKEYEALSSVTDLAQKYGVNSATIYHYLHEKGVRTRRKKSL